MPDYAPNYTARYKCTYTTLGKTHSMQWRLAASVTDFAAVATKMGLFLADLAPALYEDWTVLHAEAALADSDVFLPAPAPDQPTGAGDVDPAKGANAAIAVSYIARSIAGGKGRFFLYGLSFDALMFTTPGKDYRYYSSESTYVSDTVVRLNETSPELVCNDNEPAVWYEYINQKPNDRWVRKLRRG